MQRIIVNYLSDNLSGYLNGSFVFTIISACKFFLLVAKDDLRRLFINEPDLAGCSCRIRGLLVTMPEPRGRKSLQK